MIEFKVQCPAEKCAPKQDQEGTVEDPLGRPTTELSEGPSRGRSEKSSKESLQETEDSSEVPERLLGASPVPVTSNLERLDKDNLESVAPQGEIHFSAKEHKKEDSQWLQEKHEMKDKHEKEKQENEVLEDTPPMESLLPTIPTTTVDVQYEDQRPALKKCHDGPPADVFSSQRSQLELQNQNCHPPFELLGEELLTSFVVVNNNLQEGSQTSDGIKTASPQTARTAEPPESTLDSSETFDVQPAVARTSRVEKRLEEEEVKGETAFAEPSTEMFPSVQEPEGHSQETGMLPDFTQKEDLLPNSIEKERLPPKSAPEEVELPLMSTNKEELSFASTQEKEELRLDSIQAAEVLPISTQEDELAPTFIQEEQDLIHYSAEEENLPPPNSAQLEERHSILNKAEVQEVQLLSNSTSAEELLCESTQKLQLQFDSTQKEVLLPFSNQEEKPPSNSAHEKEARPKEEKLLCEFGQEEEELPPDSAPEVRLHSDLIQKDELLPEANNEEQLPSNSAQEMKIPDEAAQEKKCSLNSTEKMQLLPNSVQEKELTSKFGQEEKLLHDSSQEELLSPHFPQDDTTPPVTTVSWWSSAGRDPAPGDWILIPEFLSAANEDTYGEQVENEYERLMDQFAAQVEESLKYAVEVIDREGREEEEEMKKKSRVAQEVEEEKVEKKDDKEKKGGKGEEQMKKMEEAGKEEKDKQERRRTEISIMEATMDANEWVTDSGQQPLPWLGTSTQEPVEESSTLCAGGGTAPRVAAIPPLMPHTVEVTFRLHYLTWSEQQTLAITGNRPELGGWGAFIPLEREGEEKGDGGEGWGLWSGRVRLPAHSQLEWKFVVLDMGRVSRWEECRNRVLDTGDRDQLVHGWWGKE